MCLRLRDPIKDTLNFIMKGKSVRNRRKKIV